jgi:lipopolysaccharide/colanic/teichoic acid biosynthesis glycosyltransferase
MTWLTAERPWVRIYQSFYQMTKRVLEIIVCLLVLPVLAFLTLVIAVAIHLDSPGPIFLIQKRIGKGGRYFDIIKFRTRNFGFSRVLDQAFTEAFVKDNLNFPAESYDNFTSVGHILRRIGFDELPQLINILKGDMSFVGPRPIAPREIAAYQEWHKERVAVVPGLTGLAQVRGRSGLLIDEIAQYDIEYIEKRGFWLDLKILWWAMLSVLFNKGKT